MLTGIILSTFIACPDFVKVPQVVMNRSEISGDPLV